MGRMKKAMISEALGEIRADYIQEAVNYRPKKTRRWPMLAAAACLILVLAGGWLLRGMGEELPMLSARFDPEGGMGFEGMMLYDISETSQTNPWTADAQLDTLPVYRNLAYTGGAGEPVYLRDRDLLALAEETAESLGTAITATSYEPALEGNGTVCLTAEIEGGIIRVFGNGGVNVEFAQPQPRERGKTLTGAYTVEDPWTDYAFDGEALPHDEAWKPADNLEEAILHYNFTRASYFFNEEGKLWLVKWGDLLQAAEKLGDYPIRTVDEARDCLLAGDYITSVPEEYGGVGREAIAKEELIYRTGNGNQVFQPYYRFYVELTNFDTERAEGLKMYGAYYVPAVSGDYLTDFPD